MGEVYRARDPRLGRDVAIKVSVERFSERFDREARAVAALNHPNICAIYDVGPNYLVMEFIEGDAPKGPLPLEDVLRIARQIGDALEEAHGKGIVHRDLKPANIMIKPDGVVKVLDFGLAKMDAGPVALSEDSLTVSMAATQTGVILGTAAYMSPEQALGKPVDKRADIWAFGVVLYKLLTGKSLFTGETAGEILAKVIRDEPDLSEAPAELRPLLNRCLQKDPKNRLRDIGDRELLVRQAEGAPISRGRRPWVWIAATAVLLVALAAVSFIHFRENPQLPLRATIAAPEGTTLIQSFAVSPDGRYLVIAAEANGKRQLWLRAMDADRPQPIPGTEDARQPFWSPDSRDIAFFADGELKKVAVSGGPAQSLCDVGNSRGGSWSRDGVIVFSPNGGGASIQRVAAAGGAPAEVTKTKGDQGYPVFLPDGRHFLYLARGGSTEKSGIFVSSLDGTENRRILADVSGVVFAPPARDEGTGHILFIRENTLIAAPFDAASAQIAGDPFPVAEGVSLIDNWYLPATVSDNGVLLYATGSSANGINQIGWYDRTGKSLGLVGAPGEVFDPTISQDEKSVVFERTTNAGGDLWVRTLNSGRETRFTNDSSSNLAPFWSPKGDRIVFSSNRTGVYNLYEKASNGSGQDELLLPDNSPTYPSQWSRDGRYIVYFEIDPKNKRDIWVLPTEGGPVNRKPIPFLRTEFDEFMGQLSPDSHWMAFTSDRSGRREVYVRPFPPSEGEWTISLAGGQAPRWSGDGKELFFETADGKMTAVPVNRAASGAKPFFEPGTPVALFDAHWARAGVDTLFQYDVTADGKRFLIATSGPGAASATPLTVVTNWAAGLRK